jgi:hypothetical protein
MAKEKGTYKKDKNSIILLWENCHALVTGYTETNQNTHTCTLGNETKV